MFNGSAAFVATFEGVPHALVTQPHRPGVHEYRWTTATLACSELLFGRLRLPEAVDSIQPFMMSSCRTGSAISDARAVETQFGCVRSLAAVTNEHDATSPWRLKEFARDDLEETIALMRRGYTHDVESDPELSEQRSELEQILENDAGWCWIVRSEDDSSVTGAVSYIAMHIEISETPGALVSELVVDPRHRRKGLAVLMQRHAYA